MKRIIIFLALILVVGSVSVAFKWPSGDGLMPRSELARRHHPNPTPTAEPAKEFHRRHPVRPTVTPTQAPSVSPLPSSSPLVTPVPSTKPTPTVKPAPTIAPTPWPMPPRGCEPCPPYHGDDPRAMVLCPMVHSDVYCIQTQ